MTDLSDRELATVLAALHYWQDEMAGDKTSYPEHFAGVTRLTPGEVAGLCDRLNASRKRHGRRAAPLTAATVCRVIDDLYRAVEPLLPYGVSTTVLEAVDHVADDLRSLTPRLTRRRHS